MDGRDERMRRIEQSNFQKAKELPMLLQDFYYSLANLSPNTKKQYLTQIDLFFKGVYGNNYNDDDILRVTGDDINRYLASRFDQSAGKSIVAMQVSSITKLYNYLQKRKLIVYNPVGDSSGRPRIPQKEEVVYLEPDEVRQLMDNIRNGVGDSQAGTKKRLAWKYRDLAIMHVFIFTGIRKAALVDLNVGDIDLDKGIMRVVDKGDKPRELYLDNSTIQALRDWIDNREQVLQKYRYSTEALFVTYFGRISVKGIDEIVAHFTQTIGKHISPHKLRSTFGTMYYRACGGDLLMTQEAMGHADVKTTQRYAVPDKTQHKSIINSMARNIKS